jgi:hypothetical protein
MKLNSYLAGSTIALLMLCSTAMAQGLEGGERDQRQWSGQHDSWQGGQWRRMFRQHPGASFVFRLPNRNFSVNCSANEPVKVCVEAAATLLDRLRERPGQNQPGEIDPFTNPAGGSLPFTMECTKKLDNGDCVQSKCTKDAGSDCTNFVSGCFKHDGYYQGTADSGTCTKIM